MGETATVPQKAEQVYIGDQTVKSAEEISLFFPSEAQTTDPQNFIEIGAPADTELQFGVADFTIALVAWNIPFINSVTATLPTLDGTGNAYMVSKLENTGADNPGWGIKVQQKAAPPLIRFDVNDNDIGRPALMIEVDIPSQFIPVINSATRKYVIIATIDRTANEAEIFMAELGVPSSLVSLGTVDITGYGTFDNPHKLFYGIRDHEGNNHQAMEGSVSDIAFYKGSVLDLAAREELAETGVHTTGRTTYAKLRGNLGIDYNNETEAMLPVTYGSLPQIIKGLTP